MKKIKLIYAGLIMGILLFNINARGQEWSNSTGRVFTTDNQDIVGVGTGSFIDAKHHIKADTDSVVVHIIQAHANQTADMLQWKLGTSIKGVFDETGQVGIGTTDPISDLDVGGVTGNSNWKINVYQSSTTNSVAAIVCSTATPATANHHGYGVKGYCDPDNGAKTRGVYGESFAPSATNGRAKGVEGYAGNGTDGLNYGVSGRLAGTRNGAAIFGTVDGDMDVGGTYAGYFDGVVGTNDDDPCKPTAGGWVGCSDRRLKTQIEGFNDGLSVINSIKPVRYQFNGIGGLPTNKTFIGVIAQDIQDVAPYCVLTGKTRMKEGDIGAFPDAKLIRTDSSGSVYDATTLRYKSDGLLYVMINAIKELSEQNNAVVSENQSLRNDLNQLSTEVEELRRLVLGEPSQNIPTDPGNVEEMGIILNQNDPNPFAERTTITYELPVELAHAELLVYNLSGKLVKRVALEQGSTSVEVFASDLSSGMYSYSIVSNGDVLVTKKMVVTK